MSEKMPITSFKMQDDVFRCLVLFDQQAKTQINFINKDKQEKKYSVEKVGYY